MTKKNPVDELTDIDKSLQELANIEEEKIRNLCNKIKPAHPKKFNRLESIKEVDESVEENEIKIPATTTKPSLFRRLKTLVISKSGSIYP